MAISEEAQKNHDVLFPGHVSTLKQTDPELIEYFDNFAFGDVLAESTLDTRTRLILQLGSMIASQALGEYRVMLGAALGAGVTPVEAKEVVYHAVPYVGMAKVFDFLHATNEILVERGVELPLPGQSTTTRDTRAEKGLAIQKEIIGADRIDAMYASAPADQLHIQRFLSENCFGDHYTRTGLDAPLREPAHLRDAHLPRRMRAAGRRARRGERRGRQYPGDPCRRADEAAALHRLPAHPQRAAHRQRSDTTVNTRAGASEERNEL
ncbi:carboxymuconolactone decarboxylase family protein [Cryobacterium breve]|uniref:Carboxymuconolactone decarboxylase family protein n=1 Tax=Cryobacterium breve TaxID=1259258 RepID=A0ABY7NBQ6_9MICO|nr:carboxymuconolactone decarboxylase family protein [Cryobacterium breve]WBM79931.1 carboxymuconolactone decarboxylase family protein [Cryobacterium breve]